MRTHEVDGWTVIQFLRQLAVNCDRRPTLLDDDWARPKIRNVNPLWCGIRNALIPALLTCAGILWLAWRWYGQH